MGWGGNGEEMGTKMELEKVMDEEEWVCWRWEGME